MNDKRRLQRLNQLYANVDVPALNPAEHALEIRPESESLPSQVEQQISDAIISPETNQMDFADSNETVEDLGVSPLPTIAYPIPAPRTSQPRIEATVQVARPLAQPLETDEPGQAGWKAVGIGALTGMIVSGIILVATSEMHIFNNPGRLTLWGGEMFLGIMGALIANARKSNMRELWRAAIEWTLVPVCIALFIGFCFWLLMFTSLTG